MPLQTLFDFKRVHVKAGETVKVHFDSPATDFSQVDAEGRHYALPGEYTVRFGVRGPGMGFAEARLQALLTNEPEVGGKLECWMCKKLAPTLAKHECTSKCQAWWNWTQGACKAVCEKLVKHDPKLACQLAGYCPVDSAAAFV